MISTAGRLEHLSDLREGWVNVRSLNGQLGIKFREGTIKEFALLQNLVNLMKYPIVLAIPIMREVFLTDEALKFYRRKRFSMSLRAMPYELIEGNFTVGDGVIMTEDLILTSYTINLAASGSMNMNNNNAFDVKVAARPYSAVGNLIGGVPLLGNIWVAVQDKVIMSYYEIEGILGEPEVRNVDLERFKRGSKKTYNSAVERMKFWKKQR
jgi:hypothetical protein